MDNRLEFGAGSIWTLESLTAPIGSWKFGDGALWLRSAHGNHEMELWLRSAPIVLELLYYVEHLLSPGVFFIQSLGRIWLKTSLGCLNISRTGCGYANTHALIYNIVPVGWENKQHGPTPGSKEISENHYRSNPAICRHIKNKHIICFVMHIMSQLRVILEQTRR